MLESTANFIGKDGFNWWVGQVENTGAGTEDFPNDRDETNKVKVRILEGEDYFCRNQFFRLSNGA